MQVRDGGGIEPDVVKARLPSGALEHELARKDMFFKFADVWQAKRAAAGMQAAAMERPSILVTDDIYQDFQKFVLEQVAECV